jgi:hypothetical protein
VKFFLAILICALAAPAGLGQTNPKAKQSTAPTGPGEADRLGMTCAQILQMSSTDWVAHFKEKDASAEGSLRAIAAFGKCYDARTNRLAATLGKAGKGPLMGARGNFGDFEKALNDFAAMALAATSPPASEEKKAYAALYEKQFRYEFYESYAQKSAKPAAHATGKSPAETAPAANASAPAQTSSPTEVSELTKAKNRFGELLGLLPEEKMHELHKGFGWIFSGAPVSDATKIEVYRYAIFLLEPATEKPFSHAPF